MKEISLGGRYDRGKVALVDDEDYDYLSKFRWYGTPGYRNRTYYACSSGALKILLGLNKAKNVTIHRLIMGVTDSKILIDHKDGNGLNNQRSNLRICNRSENQANSGSRAGSSSIYRGVSFNTKNKNWRVRIFVHGKEFNIGSFKSEIEAAIKYNETAEKYFGEFAKLNVIDENSTIDKS